MSKPSIMSIEQAQIAFDASARLLDKAKASVESRQRKHERNTQALHNAMVAHRPLHAGDLRLRVVCDETMSWHSEKAMVEDIFGDTWCDSDAYHDEQRCAARGGCNYSEQAQEYVNARHNGSGIYSFGAILQVRNRVTGAWSEHDSCFGFYSLSDTPTREELQHMFDTVSPIETEVGRVDVIYGLDDE